MTWAQQAVPARSPSNEVGARRMPGWGIVLIGYLVSRLVTTALLLVAYSWALADGRAIAQFERPPDLIGFLQSWDGLNYREIAERGYPRELPTNSSGLVEKNVWAFLPVFPGVVNAVRSVIPGADWGAVAVLVAAVCGAAATVTLYLLLHRRFGEHQAIWGALLFCFGPLSFTLQVAYAESLFLLLMFGALLALSAGRYGWVSALGVLAAFTRPGALALPAAIGLIQLVRLLNRERIPRSEWIASAAAVVLVSAAGLAWPVIAETVTGTPDAYFRTELAWWRDHIGEVGFIPFSPAYLMAWRYWGVTGVALVLAISITAIWLLARPRVRALGLDSLAYCTSYLAYVAAVFLPQQSLFRILLPLAPLAVVPALSARARWRWLALGASMLVQPLAIWWLWIENPP